MELQAIAFIRERLRESDVELETRDGTAFYDLFIKPQELMLEPLIAAQAVALTSQSVKRILDLEDPDAFDEIAVDDLASNQYVTRAGGDLARCTVRVLYAEPLDKEFPALSAEFQAGSLSYFNSEDVVITASEMSLNQQGSLFFVDLEVVAETEGSEYNQDVDAITVFVNDEDAVSVTNITEAIGGLPRETNTQLLNRIPESVAVRDLETGKGINAILKEKFPYLQRIRAIGFGDPEMMRDILYNAHVGGKTDVYLKTPALVQKSKQIIGLTFDTTRELEINTLKAITAELPTDPESATGTPFIVTNSVVIKEDVIETSAEILSASVPPVTGIDLTGAEWVKLELDNGTALNIKVSGANVANTQRFEIINSINAALGQAICTAQGTNLIRMKSQLVGANSRIRFLVPDAPRTDATLTLFPNAATYGYPAVGDIQGLAAQQYVETIDFSVDYVEGKIWKLPGSAILSGDTIVGPAANGGVTLASTIFTSPTPNEFSDVRVGDSVNITASIGVASGEYLVRDKIDNQTLDLQGLVVTVSDPNVSYNIVSNQVVNLTYKYNPLSVDIGSLVKLPPEGLTRGVRPGREDFTIDEMPFLDIIEIEEIDPETLEGLGVFLVPIDGWGTGGWGEGEWGSGGGGDYQFRVLSPSERFSMFEDSILLFEPQLFGKSYEIRYWSAPEIGTVHDISRSDLERVTGADVLAKNFVPGFVDIDIVIVRDPTNLSAPDNAGLAEIVAEYVESLSGEEAIQQSEIDRLLENAGVERVVNPMEMRVTVVNTDGSTSIYTSTDELTLPDVTLPRDTPNYVTKRIVHFYARNITVTELGAV